MHSRQDRLPERWQPSGAKIKSQLLDQVREAVRLRHYSIRTEHTYVDWVYRFVMFHNKRHPREMGAPEINRFLTHLACKCNVAASTQNQALNAILFLYKLEFLQRIGIAAMWVAAFIAGRRQA